MLDFFLFNFDIRNYVLIIFSLFIVYLTYYSLSFKNKRPVLRCGGELQSALSEVAETESPWRSTWWCSDSRLQTVLAPFLRGLVIPQPTYRRELFKLKDGGTVALDWANELEPDKPLLLLLPGLTGSSNADYASCVAGAAKDLNSTYVVMTQRGLGGIPLTTPRLFSAVSYDDLAQVVQELRQRTKGPFLAVGVSLGGVILGQYVSHFGRASKLSAALLISSPLDVAGAARRLDHLTSWFLARALVRAVRPHAETLALPERALRARSLRAFDAAWTAPQAGFASAEEYYEAASLHDKLHDAHTPTLCVVAADDPVARPSDDVVNGWDICKAPLLVLPAGGHLGFAETWRVVPSLPLLRRLPTNYFTALLSHPHLLHTPPSTPTKLAQ